MRYGWPSEPTIRRVLEGIDAAELDLLTGTWLFERARRDAEGLLVIAVDGRGLRGAWTGERERVTLFSAMMHGEGVTVAQVRVPEHRQRDTAVCGTPRGMKTVIKPTLGTGPRPWLLSGIWLWVYSV